MGLEVSVFPVYDIISYCSNILSSAMNSRNMSVLISTEDGETNRLIPSATFRVANYKVVPHKYHVMQMLGKKNMFMLD